MIRLKYTMTFETCVPDDSYPENTSDNEIVKIETETLIKELNHTTIDANCLRAKIDIERIEDPPVKPVAKNMSHNAHAEDAPHINKKRRRI